MVPAFEQKVEPAHGDTPWADRRLADRRPPRSGARVVVRRGALGRGPDVAVELLDVSGGGAKVRVRARVRAGDPVFVALSPPSGAWKAGGPATVCWSTSEADGTVLAGVRFRHALTERQVVELAE
jgi:hypothetical protein